MKFSAIQDSLNNLLAHASSDGVVIIDSGRPGAVVGLTALTHGNEISGILTADQIASALRSGRWQMASGKLLILLSNYEILRDATGFEQLIRHRGIDLNRIWDSALPAVAKEKTGGGEFAVRERLLPYLNQLDSLIDLHSTSLESTPIGILKTDTNTTLNQVCEVLDVPFLMPNIGDYLNGTAMIERHHELVQSKRSDDDGSSHPSYSLVIEAGQHFDFNTLDRNVENVAALLQLSGVLHGTPRRIPKRPMKLNTYFAGLAQSAGHVIEWVYSDNPAGFDHVPDGTHVCNLHGEAIHAIQDSYVVMPQHEARNAGQEMFYLAAAMTEDD